METAEQIVGPYKIQSQLGKSENYPVFLARHQSTGEEVVIRFFVPESPFSRAVMRRFEHSGSHLAELSHPNLVPVREAGIFQGVPYLVSDYKQGQALHQKKEAVLDPAKAAHLLTPLSHALVYLHQHHLPHRNVQSKNILLGKNLLLTDSGFVQLSELLGMQPADETDGVQRDIRGLAQVFLEMISGVSIPAKTIWTKESLENALRHLHRKHPQVSPAVEALLRSALLSEAPFEDMQAFGKALAEIEGGEYQESSTSIPARRTQRGAVQSRAAESKSVKKKRGWLWLLPVSLLAIAIIAVGILLVNNGLNPDITPAATSGADLPVPSDVPAAEVAGNDSQPDAAPRPTETSPVPTETSEPTAAPPGVGSVRVSQQDGMELVYVPAGEFQMGSNDREEDEKPMHGVYLDAFWIDRTEVTNAMFARCVEAGACRPPVSNISSRRQSYFDNPEFADFPVIFVTWGQANDYCAWAGRRLPTEAEWEKAARGTEGYICPWGNNSPSSNQLNFNGENGDTTRTGNYPAGASVYGALDMAGNVWEWVSDWYSSKAYAQPVYENPTGPEDGTRRVLRGGSWYYPLNEIRAANRFSASDNTALNDIGFRCALPAE